MRIPWFLPRFFPLKNNSVKKPNQRSNEAQKPVFDVCACTVYSSVQNEKERTNNQVLAVRSNRFPQNDSNFRNRGNRVFRGNDRRRNNINNNQRFNNYRGKTNAQRSRFDKNSNKANVRTIHLNGPTPPANSDVSDQEEENDQN